jgi:perosamine synthetase
MVTTSEKLAINGGRPVRNSLLSYGKQCLQQDDIDAVTSVLTSDWLTTGPRVTEFEHAFAQAVQVKDAVAVSNGTAALHTAMYALGIREGDEVIVPTMTFAATANCVLYRGARPVFADVDPGTLLIDPECVEALITPRTKAIIAVDYAGHPCDYDRLADIAEHHNLRLVDDACHALGGKYRNRPVGTLAELNTFSFHPVKHITTGEGGMIATDNPELARRMRLFRAHGIATDHRQREQDGSWVYEMIDLGYNYRLTDFQCALGTSQLKHLTAWVERRQEIARRYTSAFRDIPGVNPLAVRKDVSHAYHLYVVQFDPAVLKNADRTCIFKALRAEGIGVNVHYIPVHLHPYYRDNLGTRPGQCPVAESAYGRIISLPMFPRMSDRDAEDVITAVGKVARACL